MGLIQRVIEEKGIPTVSITLNRTITEKVNPPRALYLRWPFGHPLGEPGNIQQQRRILFDCFRAAREMTVPGSIWDLPYRWKREIYD